jgi:hypothetical protein
MNIFYLDNDPKVCAEMHNDKHCIKMILEYAQLLSTAHRVLDGEEYFELTANGRRIKRWELSDDREEKLYKASHINHPSAIWCRKGIIQYRWLHNLLIELCKEYTYRYGKIHKVERDGLLWKLEQPPKNIHTDVFWSEPTPAMPDEVKIPGDSMASYHNYYINNKTHLASWRGKINSRNVPGWYNAQL